MHDGKIASNTVYQLLSRIISSALGLGITLIIAGKLHTGGYGDFTTITTYVGLFYLLIDFGINAVFLQHEITSQRFRSLLYTRLFVAFLLIVFINGITYIIPKNSMLGGGFSESVRFGIFVFSFTLLGQAIQLCTAALFQKILRYDLAMWATIAGALATFLWVVFFSFVSLPLPYLLGAYVIGAVVSSSITIAFISYPLVPVHIEKPFMKKVLLESVPLGLMLICNLIYFRIDVLLLSILKSSTDVGIYGYAYKFFDFLIAIPLFLSNALYPLLLQVSKNSEKFVNLIRRYFLIFFGLSLVLLAASWILAPVIAWLRPEFTSSIFTFRLLSLSLPFFFATSILQWALITLQKQRFLLFVYFISTLINIGLNIWYIPLASYHASAIITSVSEAIVFVLLVVKFFSISKNMQYGK